MIRQKSKTGSTWTWQFGTAGLRGIIGAGTNRMNRYTVARAAEGFARYPGRPGRGDQEPRRGHFL